MQAICLADVPSFPEVQSWEKFGIWKTTNNPRALLLFQAHRGTMLAEAGVSKQREWRLKLSHTCSLRLGWSTSKTSLLPLNNYWAAPISRVQECRKGISTTNTACSSIFSLLFIYPLCPTYTWCEVGVLYHPSFPIWRKVLAQQLLY